MASQPGSTTLDAGGVRPANGSDVMILSPAPHHRRRPAPAEAEIEGHDGGHVNELVELELLHVLRRPVPDDGNVKRLDQLDLLLARHNDLVSQHPHQQPLQFTLKLVRLGRGGRHDGQEKTRLRPPQLGRRHAGREDDGREVADHAPCKLAVRASILRSSSETRLSVFFCRLRVGAVTTHRLPALAHRRHSSPPSSGSHRTLSARQASQARGFFASAPCDDGAAVEGLASAESSTGLWSDELAEGRSGSMAVSRRWYDGGRR
ncbi:hypothetical protein CP532_6325 [Ophiocordyceps camponoti-leonardi (nom. inval.)]|nr:hypothetical protein CP532_6325 [Ophiocordyceps camponoti-leonardi (nom. inval.)]